MAAWAARALPASSARPPRHPSYHQRMSCRRFHSSQTMTPADTIGSRVNNGKRMAFVDCTVDNLRQIKSNVQWNCQKHSNTKLRTSPSLSSLPTATVLLSCVSCTGLQPKGQSSVELEAEAMGHGNSSRTPRPAKDLTRQKRKYKCKWLQKAHSPVTTAKNTSCTRARY